MDEMKYARLTEVLGRWKAEIVEILLESEGMDVVLVQDSLSQSAYSNPFAPVQIFVPKESLDQARELVKDLEGVLQESDEMEEEETEEADENYPDGSDQAS
jgi:hypothetical protein